MYSRTSRGLARLCESSSNLDDRILTSSWEIDDHYPCAAGYKVILVANSRVQGDCGHGRRVRGGVINDSIMTRCNPIASSGSHLAEVTWRTKFPLLKDGLQQKLRGLIVFIFFPLDSIAPFSLSIWSRLEASTHALSVCNPHTQSGHSLLLRQMKL